MSGEAAREAYRNKEAVTALIYSEGNRDATAPRGFARAGQCLAARAHALALRTPLTSIGPPRVGGSAAGPKYYSMHNAVVILAGCEKHFLGKTEIAQKLFLGKMEIATCPCDPREAVSRKNGNRHFSLRSY